MQLVPPTHAPRGEQPNPPASEDAAMGSGLHIGRQRGGASEQDR